MQAESKQEIGGQFIVTWDTSLPMTPSDLEKFLAHHRIAETAKLIKVSSYSQST